ncbi:MAG: PLP-dependent enzyme glutamate decarboxylase [Chlorobi bacterium]|nr:PLP-dependent enzyme glutamate decarboxylase [Chlorobiota bacterium]
MNDGNDVSHERLTLSADEMRRMGYRVIDMLVEHFEQLGDLPVAGGTGRRELERLLREPPPEEGRPPGDVLDRVGRDVFGNMSHVDHPRFFAYVPGPGNFVGAMANALVAGFNPFAGAWATASGAAEIELVTVDWLRDICGLPASAGGTFVSGGSMANLTALAAARHALPEGDIPRAVIYASDQTHSSIDRGARLLGFRRDQLRTLPTDEDFRLPIETLRNAIAADRAAGKRPFALVANGGTTNTGAVDPLPELAALRDREGLWMHVDGAYGAAAALTERGRRALAGMELADSVSLDPHKWLFQPFECGCILLRDAQLLKETFRLVPEYLRDSDLAAEEVNFRDWGVQLTRGFRGLDLWMSVQVFGLEAFRAAVDRGIDLALLAERRLHGSPAWRVITSAGLGIVTFRFTPDNRAERELDEINRRIAGECVAGRHAMLSTTVLRGRTVLRLCTINPRTSDDDILGTIERLEIIGRRIAEG